MRGKLSLLIASMISINISYAASYTMPSNQESVIGQVQYGAVPTGENNVAKLNHHFDIGYNEIIEANPDINFSKPVRSGTTLKVPTQYLLPNHPREGIVVNLPEMRMYYYQPESGQISTYPIGIGKIGKTIPLAQAKITRKTKNPTWIPTPDIREFNLSQGIVLPQIMPAGPDNPLGPYAIYMTIPTYLMHSTIFPESIGKRASFGCIRMYQSDIESFFPVVTPGIPVAIINSPTKVAWQKNHLFMEAHPPLEEHNKEFTATLPGTVTQIEQLTKQKNVLVDWQAVAFIENARDGLPHEIGMKIVR